MKMEYYWEKYFTKCKNILDVGCGQGNLLQWLKEKKLSMLGVDNDKENIEICKNQGFDVICEDMFGFLETKKNIYDGIYLGHVIEHLSPEKAMELISKMYQALAPGGIVIIATPDVKNIKDMLYGFWTDPTHVRFYPLCVLEKFFQQLGYKSVEKVELRWDYRGKILWKFRDALRNALIGEYWGRDQVLIIGSK